MGGWKRGYVEERMEMVFGATEMNDGDDYYCVEDARQRVVSYLGVAGRSVRQGRLTNGSCSNWSEIDVKGVHGPCSEPHCIHLIISRGSHHPGHAHRMRLLRHSILLRLSAITRAV